MSVSVAFFGLKMYVPGGGGIIMEWKNFRKGAQGGDVRRSFRYKIAQRAWGRSIAYFSGP